MLSGVNTGVNTRVNTGVDTGVNTEFNPFYQVTHCVEEASGARYTVSHRLKLQPQIYDTHTHYLVNKDVCNKWKWLKMIWLIKA